MLASPQSAIGHRRRRTFSGLSLAVLTGCILAGGAAAALPGYEIVIVTDPAVVRHVGPDASGGFLKELLAGKGLADPLRVDKLGAAYFAVPEALSLRAAQALVREIRRTPGIIHAGVTADESARRKLAQSKAFETAGEPDIVGVIIKYRDPAMGAKARANETLPLEEIARLASIAGVEFVRHRAMSGESFALWFRNPVDQLTASSILARLDADPQIEFASPNAIRRPQLVPNDTFFGQQWALAAGPAGIDAPSAWDVTTGLPGTVVAVVDTGLLNHPEFAGRILPGYDFVGDPIRAADGDGRDANATDAGDWVPTGLCGAGSPADNSSWHGTHVAGTIGATGNNGAGIAGLDWQAKILPVRVLGRCGGDLADIVDGMRWAAGLPVPGVPNNPTPARVINMSLTGGTPCWQNPAEQSAAIEILAAGAALVVAAGNDNSNAANYSPAGCYGVLTVGATGPDGELAPYSNFSDAVIDVSAPGGNLPKFGAAGGILSTYATGTQTSPGQGTYKALQGTSMAAPHVSGVVSLMLGANPGLTISQIRDIVIGSAKPFPAGTNCATSGRCGAGLLDAAKAVTYAKAFTNFDWNFTDHWWNASESGWGAQVTAQGDIQFVTWYTYASDGSPVWLTMVLTRLSQDIFVGDVYFNLGTPLAQINGKPASLQELVVGKAVLMYFGWNEAWLYYKIGTNERAVRMRRLVWSDKPTLCTWTTGSRADAVNYQDMWWYPPETGWGVNVTHQGDIIFATWFTYDPDGLPIWLYMIAEKTPAGVYSGEIRMTKGIPHYEIDGQSPLTADDLVGSGTLTFASGERGKFDYNVFGFVGSKPIERQVFASPVSKCRSLGP